MDSRPAQTTCAAGCGFFGREETEWYCSKCYREKKQRESSPPAAPQAAPTDQPGAVALDGASGAGGADGPPAKRVQKKRTRCLECNKKIGLTGLECRCGFVFCSAHRYPDQHACDFDYKAHDKAILAKRNQKVDGNGGLVDKM